MTLDRGHPPLTASSRAKNTSSCSVDSEYQQFQKSTAWTWTRVVKSSKQQRRSDFTRKVPKRLCKRKATGGSGKTPEKEEQISKSTERRNSSLRSEQRLHGRGQGVLTVCDQLLRSENLQIQCFFSRRFLHRTQLIMTGHPRRGTRSKFMLKQQYLCKLDT